MNSVVIRHGLECRVSAQVTRHVDSKTSAAYARPSTVCIHSSLRRQNHLRVLPRAQRRSATPRAAARGTVEAAADKTKTEEIFETLEQRQASGRQAGGAGGGTTFQALKRADQAWAALRNPQAERQQIPEFVKRQNGKWSGSPEYDVAVCGGTLGIFLACALQLKGLRVAVVERGPLKGREQEWNISRKEIGELVEEGLLTADEAEECIGVEFNPVRVGFHGGTQVWTRDVLNVGVQPDKLIAKVRQRFEQLGGKVFEFAVAKGVVVHDDAAVLKLAADSGSETAVAARLLIDGMGNFSPIVRQARGGAKPDGICLVVGTCSRGFDPERNTTGDVIYTNGPIQTSPEAPVRDLQYFWEAFPAGSGPGDRTTYMFTYVDADPRRPSLLDCLEDYWRLMPQYQGVHLEDLEVLRILFGFFPTYRDSPLKPAFDRVVQIGDASGIQSPLSFGGFGALSRHLRRLRAAVAEALEADRLDRTSLAAINAYNPGLSSAWMMQRAMSVRPGQAPEPQFINTLLSENFVAMQELGDPVLKPFLQDVVKFGPMGQTLTRQMLSHPGFIPQILAHVGPGPLLDWMRHYLALGLYTALYRALRPLDRTISRQLRPGLRFRWKRALEALQFGSGSDYRP